MRASGSSRPAALAGGLLLVDKPAGVTSHDVVAVARRALSTRRIGHAGTLDPFATGLLVLLVGRETRLLPYVDGDPKVYDATIRFGAETATDDLTGAVVREAAVPVWADGGLDALVAATAALTGELDQRPPAYSAKHVGGERAYELARRGEAPELPTSRVRVDAWEVRAARPGELDVTITCGGGTYIRALARDLGRALGSAAHLGALRRVRSGPADVRDAVSLEELQAGRATLRSPAEALGDIAIETVGAEGLRRIARGQSVPATVPGARALLVDDARQAVAVAERARDEWQPRVVLLESHG
jgi:tRNA pseudouridine55 synthase